MSEKKRKPKGFLATDAGVKLLKEKMREFGYIDQTLANAVRVVIDPHWDKSQNAPSETIKNLLNPNRKRPAGRAVIEAACHVLKIDPKQIVEPNEWDYSPSPKSPSQNRISSNTTNLGYQKWQQTCRTMLDNRKCLTIDVLTGGDGPNLEETFVPLGLVERRKSNNKDRDNSRDSQRQQRESGYQVTQQFEKQEDFFEQVLSQGETLKSPNSQGRRIAITGESGSGKTTLLLKIGFWVSDKTEDVPIWISLKDIGEKTLAQYLKEDWLSKVGGTLEEWEELLKSDRVWLLLDGVEDLAPKWMTPLRAIAEQLTDLSGNLRVVLTCRSSVWKADQYALEAFKFDTYQNLGLETEGVEQFINGWFSDDSETVQQLKAQLDRPNRSRIKDLAKNALYLMLICRTWQERTRLPETKAELFEQFIEEARKRKVKERFSLDRIIKALGELALEALNQKQLRRSLVYQKLEEEQLQLVLCRLGWLRRADTDEEIYDFLHDSFKEFFAAKAIAATENWHYFLNPSQDIYRIFEPQWKEVILFWLGLEDLEKQQKEEFIQALITFEDDCGSFYGYRAYFLAVEGIAEFSDSSFCNKVVDHIISWGWGYSCCDSISESARDILGDLPFSKSIDALVNLLGTTNDNLNRRALAESLGKIAIGNQLAIDGLVAILSTTQDNIARILITDCLSKIAIGNQSAIYALVNLVTREQNDSTVIVVTNCLINIAIDNQLAIHAIATLIRTISTELSKLALARTLGKINPGNQLAIDTLVGLLKTSTNDFILREAAYTLGEIDSSNQLAIDVFDGLAETIQNDLPIQATESFGQIDSRNQVSLFFTHAIVGLLQTNVDYSTRKQLAYTFARIATGNQSAIDTLIALLSTTQDDFARDKVKSILQDINLDNQSIIKFLIRLLFTIQDNFSQKILAYSLPKFIQGEQFRIVVSGLKDCLASEVYENDFERFNNCYKVIWYCAQTMTYPDFYQSWHSQPTTIHPEAQGNMASGNSPIVQMLESQIADISTQLQATGNTYPLCINVEALAEETDTEEIGQILFTKVYKHQDVNIPGIPPDVKKPSQLQQHLTYIKEHLKCENMALILFIKDEHSQYQTPNQETISFCHKLADRDLGIYIAWITDTQLTNRLKSFPPQPNLVSAIQSWIDEIG